VNFLRRLSLQVGGGLDAARVSMLLKSRASLTCFRACFLPSRANDLSVPRYHDARSLERPIVWICPMQAILHLKKQIKLYSYFALLVSVLCTVRYKTFAHKAVQYLCVSCKLAQRKFAVAKGLNEITFARVPVKSYVIVKVKNASLKRLSPCYVLFTLFNRLLIVLSKSL